MFAEQAVSPDAEPRSLRSLGPSQASGTLELEWPPEPTAAVVVTSPKQAQEDAMSWTRRDVLALGSLALAGAALGPSRVAAQTPKRGGTLAIRGWDPPLFDPMLTTAYRVHVPLSLTHSRLVRHRAGPSVPPGTFPIEGDLAES